MRVSIIKDVKPKPTYPFVPGAMWRCWMKYTGSCKGTTYDVWQEQEYM